MKLLKIMQDSKRFSYTEQNVINYMIENHKILVNLSIRELSKKTFATRKYFSFVSKTWIQRLQRI